MSTKKTKKPKQRSVHEMELAEIAFNTYFSVFGQESAWETIHPTHKRAWRDGVKAVLEEAIYRVEADINSK